MLEYVLGMMNWPWLICDNILGDEKWKISRSRDTHCITFRSYLPIDDDGLTTTFGVQAEIIIPDFSMELPR